VRTKWLCFSVVIVVFAAGHAFGVGDHIRQGMGFRQQPLFVGQPAVAKPLAPLAIPAHPFLADQGRNGMHADSYASGTHPFAGPVGNNPQMTTRSLGLIGGECATVAFDAQGRIMTVSGSFNGFRLLLLDPDTLEVLASHDLPKRTGGSIFNIQAILNDTSGGAYFHLDDQHRPVIVNAHRRLQVFEVVTRSNGRLAWNVAEDYDLNAALPRDAKVTDAIPDFTGLYWFVTRQGDVGTVDRHTGTIKVHTLVGEEIQNSLAVAPDGVFVVSDFALYRFEADLMGNPLPTWRQTYDRGTSAKPGSINQGSGTTPTLLGTDLVAIVDNADSRVNVCIYKRGQNVSGSRLVVKQPVFAAGKSATENSLIGYGNSVICVNNFGYTTPFDNPWTEPGIVRIDVAPNRASHSVVWQSQEASQTTVPKLSVGNGLVYVYTRRRGTRRRVQAWYLTAIDFATGRTVFKILTGTGKRFNNNWAPITIGPNGTAYVGVLNGIIAMRDGRPGEPARTNRRLPRR
jgi:hypothetical protein